MDVPKREHSRDMSMMRKGFDPSNRGLANSKSMLLDRGRSKDNDSLVSRRVATAILIVAVMILTSFIVAIQVSHVNNEKSTALSGPGQESTTTRVYDMFNVSVNDWFSYRGGIGVLSPSFPSSYYYDVGGYPSIIYSNFRMNVTAANISEVNTTVAPWYVPVLNKTAPGGNISLNWTGNYLTYAQVVNDYNLIDPSISPNYDGWMWRWNGTVTMDRVAAKMVLNMTDSEFGNFSTWKTGKFAYFIENWTSWLDNQANVKWYVNFANPHTYTKWHADYDIVKVGDEIVFQIKDHLSWGMETLFGRWWSHTFMQYEGWPEDVHFTASMTQTHANFNLDMAVQYGLIAETSTRDGRTAWIFEERHADKYAGTSAEYNSQINSHSSAPGYWDFRVSDALYGGITAYDYTPWAWNLTNDKEKIIIQWPNSNSIIGYNQGGQEWYYSTVVGSVTPRWVEPIPGEVPGNAKVDSWNRTIAITGPFDAWTWSNTTAYGRELRENWSRVGLLPHGCPWIEFVVNNDLLQPPIAALSGPGFLYTTVTAEYNGSGSWDVDGTITNYSWDFGDGSPNAYGAKVAHSWATPRIYNVTLTVTDNSSLTASNRIPVRVIYNIPPVAIITSNDRGNVRVPMIFNGSASYDPDGYITSYIWSFGDGSTATGSIVSHTYYATGVFKVNLTVTDNRSWSNNATKDVPIFYHTPIAKILIGTVVDVNTSTPISGFFSYSQIKGRTIANYSWDFGDGTKAYAMNVTHVWSSQGRYPVTLVVRDNLGLESDPAIALIDVVRGLAGAISVNLDRRSLSPGETTSLTIAVVDSVGRVVESFTGDVSIACNKSAGVTIPSLHTFVLADHGVYRFANAVSFANVGSYNITATSVSDPSIVGYEFATVAKTTIEYRIYDMFAYPLGSYWGYRYPYGDVPYRNNSPVVEMFRPDPTTQIAAELTSTYRIHVDARNVTSINMTNPTFIPRMRVHEGGNLTISMNYHYLTNAEFWRWNRKNPDGSINFTKTDYLYTSASSAYDGWELWLNGNVTMDRAAAYQVLGLPQSVTDVTTWWNAKNSSDKPPRPTPLGNYPYYYEHYFLGNESGIWSLTIPEKPIWGGASYWNGRLDIRASDDGYPIIGYGYMSCVYVVSASGPGNNTVTLRFVHINYGEDTLISKWLYWGGTANGWNYPNGTPGGIMPFEPYYDDFNMSVQMGPTMSNITIDSGVVYALRAEKSHVASAVDMPIWRWDQTRIDYTGSSAALAANRSEMDLWYNRSMTYVAWNPGSLKYGWNVPYDFSPNIFKLALGQSLVMERPDYAVSGFLPTGFVGNKSDPVAARDGYYDWLNNIERFGNATIHPVGASPGTAIVDAGSGDLKLVGPFYPILEHENSTFPWLWTENAPRVEIWVGLREEHAPHASFVVSPSSGNDTTTFTFDASAVSDVEDTTSLLSVRWDWNSDGVWDTAWSTTKIATHQYPSVGNWLASLEVKDTRGLNSTMTRTVFVTDEPPKADFTLSPPLGDTTTVFQVNASSSSDLEDSSGVLQVRWDWEGDGVWDTGWSTTKTASHTYPVAGDYNLTLEVKDSAGLTNITKKSVHVNIYIPEFSEVAFPIFGITLLLVVAMRIKNRRKDL